MGELLAFLERERDGLLIMVQGVVEKQAFVKGFA